MMQEQTCKKPAEISHNEADPESWRDFNTNKPGTACAGAELLQSIDALYSPPWASNGRAVVQDAFIS